MALQCFKVNYIYIVNKDETQIKTKSNQNHYV